MTLAAPQIKAGQRAVVVGKTGSGKSSLANYLLQHSPNQWIILNPKRTGAYAPLSPSVTIEGIDWRKIDAAVAAINRDGTAKYRFINLIPTPAESTFEEMDAFVMALHESYTSIGLVVDELYSLNRSGRAGPGLTAWLTRGRELRQSFLGLTQRPSWVSKFVFSEADYIGEMALSLEDDRKRVFELTGQPLMLQKIPPFEWLWFDAKTEKLRWFNPVPIARG